MFFGRSAQNFSIVLASSVAFRKCDIKRALEYNSVPAAYGVWGVTPTGSVGLHGMSPEAERAFMAQSGDAVVCVCVCAGKLD